MKWIDSPVLDQHLAVLLPFHLAVLLPFAEQNPKGYPQADALDRLRRFEDRLTSELGDRALLVAHETCGGLRTLHLYADQTDRVVLGIAQQVTKAWPGSSELMDLDPGWKLVSAFG